MAALADLARELGAELPAALEQLRVPVFVIDGDGFMVYGNAAATERFGQMVGRRFTSFFAPDSIATARDAFAKKLLRIERATEYHATVLDKHGAAIPAEFSSVSLEREGRVVGVFGLVNLSDVGSTTSGAEAVRLTPRQAEVLGHLAAGCTTKQMAELMGIEIATVRNHVRDLLRRMHAHTRLEAVVRAQELGLTKREPTAVSAAISER